MFKWIHITECCIRPLLTFHVPILILLILFTLTLVLFVMLCDCSFGLGVPCFLVTRIGFVGLPMLAEIPAEEFGEPKFDVFVEVALGSWSCSPGAHFFHHHL